MCTAPTYRPPERSKHGKKTSSLLESPTKAALLKSPVTHRHHSLLHSHTRALHSIHEHPWPSTSPRAYGACSMCRARPKTGRAGRLSYVPPIPSTRNGRQTGCRPSPRACHDPACVRETAGRGATREKGKKLPQQDKDATKAAGAKRHAAALQVHQFTRTSGCQRRDRPRATAKRSRSQPCSLEEAGSEASHEKRMAAMMRRSTISPL